MTKPCHKFLGWSLNESATKPEYKNGDTIEIVGEKTLYAIWEKLPHKLSLIEEIQASCEHNGVKSHYKCSEGGKKFMDNEAKFEITSSEQLVLIGGHKFGLWQKRVEPTTKKKVS